MNLLATPDPDFNGGKDILLTNNAKKFFIPYATSVKYKEFSFGPVLLQEYISDKVKIFSYHFFAKFNCSFYAQFETPTIALQFMTAGSVEALLQGLHTPIDTGHFGLFFLPASNNEIKLPEGFSHSIHFELTETYLNDLTAIDARVQEVIDNLFNAAEKAERLAPAPFSSEVRNLLANMMQLTVPVNVLDFKLKFYIINFLEIYRNVLATDVAVSTSMPHIEIIKKIGEDIQRNPDIRLFRLNSLSAQYRLSEYVIKRLFLRVWKKTLSEFLFMHCMEKARRLLLTTTLNITKIADEIGYENDSNFTKAFKRYTNESPGKMRKNKL